MSEEGCWGRDVGFADPFRSCRCSLPLVPRVALSLPPAPLLRRSCPKLSVIVADPFRSCRCSLPLVPRVALSLPQHPSSAVRARIFPRDIH